MTETDLFDDRAAFSQMGLWPDAYDRMIVWCSWWAAHCGGLRIVMGNTRWAAHRDGESRWAAHRGGEY